MNIAKLSIICFITFCFQINLSLNSQPLGLKFKSLLFEESPINPVHVVSPPDPSDKRVFFVFQDGKVKIYENEMILDQPYLDISKTGLDLTDFGSGSEQGMLSLAFDPNHKDNGYIYVTYSGLSSDKKRPFDWHLTSFKVSKDDPNKIDTSTYKVLLEVKEPGRGHNGGQLHFGPDGFLYVCLGDGGGTTNGGDNHGPIGNGQNKKTLLGKLLRIDVNGFEDYKIPDSNPFINDTAALDEIWAYGLRNPWKFSFDKKTGDIFISDVGELSWEEVSMQPANSKGGENYGWRLKEGSHCYNPKTDCDTTTIPPVDPIFEYQHSPHDEFWRCAIIGGYSYRGEKLKPLQGYYLFADACSQEIWYVHKDSLDKWNGEIVKAEYDVKLDKYKDGITSFGEDSEGNLYICTRRGIFKLIDATFDIGQLPDEFFEFDIYPNPASDVINFKISDFGNKIKYDVTIYNNLGQIIQGLSVTQNSTIFQLNLDNLAPGSYHAIVEFENRNLRLKRKFIIAR